MPFEDHLSNDPDAFISELQQHSDPLSVETAQEIDAADPLSNTQSLFEYGDLIPLAGHSLGPSFKPSLDKLKQVHELQASLLHGGHFPTTHPEGNSSAHWFDCDRYEPALLGAQQLLGFKELEEFNFTAAGLSENLSMLLQTFYQPGKADWEQDRAKILMLGTEFFSDQAVVNSVMQRAIGSAKRFECFNDREIPTPDSEILKVSPKDETGVYSTQDIIDNIRANADRIKVICLPDIVFNTGQRLELNKILNSVRDLIEEKDIKVILDLAHTVGNRAVNLESLPVTAAVGCAYKHLSGYAGSGFGIYVSRKVNLNDYTPIQGWKAADPSRVFATINKYDADIMQSKVGAIAFRTSNPPPVPLIPAQTYLAHLGKIGFAKLFNKSECLTRYLILQLQHQLGDLFEMITPLAPNQRGATIAIRIKDIADIGIVENQLKDAGYEVDTRPPNVMRITAHYAYTTFTQINQFVCVLKQVLDKCLAHSEDVSSTIGTEVVGKLSDSLSGEDSLKVLTIGELMANDGFGPNFKGIKSADTNDTDDTTFSKTETTDVAEKQVKDDANFKPF